MSNPKTSPSEADADLQAGRYMDFTDVESGIRWIFEDDDD